MAGKTFRHALGLYLFCAIEVLALVLSPILNMFDQTSAQEDADKPTNPKKQKVCDNQQTGGGDDDESDGEYEEDSDDGYDDGEDDSDISYDSDLEVLEDLKQTFIKLGEEYDALLKQNRVLEKRLRIATTPPDQLTVEDYQFDDEEDEESDDEDDEEYVYDPTVNIIEEVKQWNAELQADCEELKKENDELEIKLRLATMPPNKFEIEEVHEQSSMV